MSAALTASLRMPTERARAWAVATVANACRRGNLELDDAEERLGRAFAADTFADLYAATAGLPHPPAPLVLSVGP